MQRADKSDPDPVMGLRQSKRLVSFHRGLSYRLFSFPACFRTPHVSSGPAWAARKKTPVPVHPGDTAQPVSEGLDKTQGQVVRQTLHRVNRCLMGTLDTLLDSLSGEGIARAITLGEPLPKGNYE